MPVNTMAMPCSSAALITSSSRIEPPGWITAVAPASIAASSPSANGKKASEATTEPLVSGSASPAALRGVLGLARGDAGGVDAAHLAGADADRGAVLGIDDGVRLHVLGDPEGEAQVGELGVGRRALGDDLELHLVDHGVVARLHQQAAGDRFHREARARADRAAPPASSSRRFFFAPTMAIASSLGVGRDDDLGEDLGDRARGLGVERAVERDDAAEGRDRIAGERLAIGVEQVRALGHAARIGVLDDRARRRCAPDRTRRRIRRPRRCR